MPQQVDINLALFLAIVVQWGCDEELPGSPGGSALPRSD